ncbi:MAG: ABC transporter substrate-binding protein [Bryobacter sp.]|nr:ABC transporter substrate-binding protein [Bryobacter sp.]
MIRPIAASFFALLPLLAAPGGPLVISQRSEPRTWNPVFAIDANTRDVLRLVHGRLGRINGQSQQPEPYLAEAWQFSPSGKRCVVQLRRGVKFSDGHPFTADDVLFSFALYQDPKLASPQKDLLAPAGKPIQIRKLSAYSLELTFAEPFAPAARLFDGLAILPKHILEAPYREGTLNRFWTLAEGLNRFAGLGPFVPAAYLPGQKLSLRPNPHFFRRGQPRLPGIEILFVADQVAEMLRFQRGEIDLLHRPLPKPFATLGPNSAKLDLGASLDYHFLVFNLNPLPTAIDPGLRIRQSWFTHREFRQAVHLALDREAMISLAFDGRATPLRSHVTPANRVWLADPKPPRRDLSQARALLAQLGFKQNGKQLLDPQGQPVRLTLAVNAANNNQTRMAAILQQDLADLGIELQIAALEFRSLVDRILKKKDYDVALMALSSGDADPNAEMNIWPLGAPMHMWNLSAAQAPAPWEREVDELMQQQRRELSPATRRALYARVQEIVARELPLVPLVSPNLLVAHKVELEGVRPSLLPPYALWNVEELRWSSPRR